MSLEMCVVLYICALYEPRWDSATVETPEVLEEQIQPAICCLLIKPLLMALSLHVPSTEQCYSLADNNGGYGYGQNNNSKSLLILCIPFTWASQACVQNPPCMPDLEGFLP